MAKLEEKEAVGMQESNDLVAPARTQDSEAANLEGATVGEGLLSSVVGIISSGFESALESFEEDIVPGLVWERESVELGGASSTRYLESVGEFLNVLKEQHGQDPALGPILDKLLSENAEVERLHVQLGGQELEVIRIVQAESKREVFFVSPEQVSFLKEISGNVEHSSAKGIISGWANEGSDELVIALDPTTPVLGYFGSKLVHENAHLNGASEFGAFKEMYKYEVRNGLLATMPTDDQIIEHIAINYEVEDVIISAYERSGGEFDNNFLDTVAELVQVHGLSRAQVAEAFVMAETQGLASLCLEAINGLEIYIKLGEHKKRLGF